jgi:hypothetical protein
MGREAVVTAVDLRHGESYPLARSCRQVAFPQRSEKAEIALDRSRADGNEPEEVRNAAELLFHSFEKRLRGGGSSFDGGWSGNARHVRSFLLG